MNWKKFAAKLYNAVLENDADGYAAGKIEEFAASEGLDTKWHHDIVRSK